MNTTLSLRDAEALAVEALEAVGVPRWEAGVSARALIAAERDGLPSHGLSRLPFYLAQARSGKVVAGARARVEVAGSVIRVDAGHGLAFPAIARGVERAIPLARELGLVAVAIGRSHHFGVAGEPVERLAREGLVAMAFSNAPSAMAPWGGKRPLYGTNPIAFATPRRDAEPLVIDLSLSKVARGKVMLAKKAGEPIPEGWALDIEGRPTTDPDAAIAGSMVPAGDAKGASLALMVELLTAGLTGSHFGFQASSFFEADGEAPSVGHLILAFDPARFSDGYLAHIEALFQAMLDQPGVRLPGARRYALRAERGESIELSEAVVAELRAYAASRTP
ncbi:MULTISPECIES: Ldh family oxidoreductase [unclassified Modicisalibacter]|uniref:Ldh family oxidoreductase n=1 Tax=unclassified Modicisalibacter TaxID=2679913 RepID=UPI001CC91607|nr:MULTISPECIES: Ldh family oxidoreductase [unclassified Modicisalibacter]MBZ9556740.1 Ldh family oxidoreductase [Modicisalibacter sp. R2A 31.J]MBZ9574791.1 Ldh family oxidoreductase [Modicisalibacter sp. MOD 31.J]